ncbi:MAG: hypothetical protein EA425_16680 [Puniceicoccaceae bacterium]|nr:MAG: hypothetical protein EA425_16680 [Puniceicoccaceae bacterium]
MLDDFSLGVPFLDVVTDNGLIENNRWLDIARDPGPSTIWATPFGSLGWGGFFDNAEAGVGGGLTFELDFGGGAILAVPGHIPGDSEGVFYGFTTDQPFVAVRVFLFDSQGGTLQETHTFDDLQVQVTPDRADLRFVQEGTGSWNTAGHWNLNTAPGPNQRIFIAPEGGTVVDGPTAPTDVLQLVVGGGVGSSQLNLSAESPVNVDRSTVIRSGGGIAGAGHLDSKVIVEAGGGIAVASGETLRVGRAIENGFHGRGTLSIGDGTLVVESAGNFLLGILTELGGGTLQLPEGTGLVGFSDVLRGHGTVEGALHFFGSSQLQVVDGTLTVADLTMVGGSVAVGADATLMSSKPGLLAINNTAVGAAGNIEAAGALRLTGTTTLGAGASLKGAGLDIVGGLNRTGPTTFDAGAGDLTLATGSIVSLGAGDALTAGRLVIGTHPNTGFATIVGITQPDQLDQVGGVDLSGGTLSASTSLTIGADKTLAANGGRISAGAGATVTIDADTTGNARLGLGGANQNNTIFRLTGENTQALGTEVFLATLEIGSDAAIGAPAGALNIGRFAGGTNQPGRLRALADFEVAATRSTAFRFMNVDTNGFDVVFNQTLAGIGLTKEGAGSLTLNTANTQSAADNPVTILGGTLRMGVDNALGPRTQIQTIAAGATLDLNGFDLEVRSLFNSFAGSAIQLGSGTLTITGGGVVDGSITGEGGVVIGHPNFFADTVRFGGSNAFTGGLTVRSGATLFVAGTQSLGGTGNTILLDDGFLGTSTLTPAPLVIDDSLNLVIAEGGGGFTAQGRAIIIERKLTGSNPIRFSGGSSWDEPVRYDVLLANPDNDFTSAIVVGAGGFNGSLGIVSDGSLGHPDNPVTLGDRTFGSTVGGLRAHADLVLPESRTIQLNGRSGETDSGGFIDTQGFTVTIEAGISEINEGMAFLKTGAGTLILTGANTYTGTTRVVAGTLAGTTNFQRVEVFSPGRLAPGPATGAGSMTVGQNLMLFGGSTLELDIGGLLAGVEHDFIEVAGLASLGGSRLEINLFGTAPFSILPTDTLTVLTAAGGIVGAFANLVDGRVETPDGLGSFAVVIDGGSLLLTDFVFIPEPSAAGLLVAALALLALAARSRHRGRV